MIDLKAVIVRSPLKSETMSQVVFFFFSNLKCQSCFLKKKKKKSCNTSEQTKRV